MTANDDYFRQKTDAVVKMAGLLSLQKICSAVCQLTSGVSSAEHDDKYRMAASTGLKAMKRFCHSIIAVYRNEALRHPNAVDIGRLLDEGCAAGFPGWTRSDWLNALGVEKLPLWLERDVSRKVGRSASCFGGHCR